MNPSAADPLYRIRLVAAEKRLRALELRKSGASYRSIGTAMGINAVTAYRYVVVSLEELKAKTADAAEEVRTIELARLDALLQGLWPAASRGDPESVRAALAVMKRRADMLGLDAPKAVEVSGGDGEAFTIRTVWGNGDPVGEPFVDITPAESRESFAALPAPDDP